MQAFLKQHRWVILAAGAAIQVLTGVPAAWGVFQRGVCEGYSLSQENAAMIFSLTICFFGIGCILGGLLPVSYTHLKKEAVGQTKLKVQKTNTASARKPRAAVLK